MIYLRERSGLLSLSFVIIVDLLLLLSCVDVSHFSSRWRFSFFKDS